MAIGYHFSSRYGRSCQRNCEYVGCAWPHSPSASIQGERLGPAHVLLSWQPRENMKLSKCWSSAFSFMRCSSKESTSLSLCSITCIISLNISLSSLRSFSSFWLSKKQKRKSMGPQVTFGPGRELLAWAFLIVLPLFCLLISTEKTRKWI